VICFVFPNYKLGVGCLKIPDSWTWVNRQRLSHPVACCFARYPLLFFRRSSGKSNLLQHFVNPPFCWIDRLFSCLPFNLNIANISVFHIKYPVETILLRWLQDIELRTSFTITIWSDFKEYWVLTVQFF
jgi:hypothetical protein